MLDRALPVLAVMAVAGAAATGTAAATESGHGLVIHHQLRGCHAWSLNEGPDRVDQSLSLGRGGSILVTNDDLMPHELVETHGPRVVYTRVTMGAPMGVKKHYPPAMLARIGATSRISFTRPGVYRFTTKVGEDFMEPVATVGPDNVLHLTVRVT